MSIDQLFAEAEILPPEDRETLAQRLWESVHGQEGEPDLDPEYMREVLRRANEMESGVVQGIPHDEVMREVQRIINAID